MKQCFLIAVALSFFHWNRASPLQDEYRNNPPVYCGNPEERSRYDQQRTIPALGSDEEALDELKLKQVQVTTRSGSRTVSQVRKCWKDFNINYSCERSGEKAMGWTGKDSRVTLPIIKRFDASKKLNKLEGTSCELGQLLIMGHSQHRLNGELLANAYFKDPTATNNLFDLQGKLTKSESLDDFIYFRSTDFERTRMSGVELLSSMVKTVDPAVVDPKIKLHTAEREVDMHRLNPDKCYDLVAATHQAFSSKEFVAKFEKKHEMARALAAELMEIEADFKKGSWPWDAFDCLGIALCSGFDLPTDQKWTRQNVDVIHAAAIEEVGWPFLANNSNFSKIANAPFTYDVKAFAVKQLCGDKSSDKTCVSRFFEDSKEVDDMIEHLKAEEQIHSNPFVYRSAHATTIGSFIASFGEKFWNDISIDYIKKIGKFDGLKSPYPSYATLMILEFYESKEDFLVRMIYNGQVITQHVPGCTQDKELCSVKTFFKAMAWATRDLAGKPCKMDKPKEKPTPKRKKEALNKKKSGALVLAPFTFTVFTAFALAQI